MNRQLLFALLAISGAVACLISDNLSAQEKDKKEPPKRLDEVVITGSKRSQKISDAVVLIELISNEDLKRTGAPDLHSALTHHTGIQTDIGGIGSGGVMIHGISSERVLILIDGQPLTGRVDGKLDLSRIPTSIVERIEVIKGPHATMYGSVAMGGVINIITRKSASSAPAVTGSFFSGSRNRFDANAALSGGSRRLNGLLGVGRRFIETSAGRVEQLGAQSQRWDVDGKAKWVPDPGSVFEGSVIGIREKQRWSASPTYFFADNDQVAGSVKATLVSESGRHIITPLIYISTFSHLNRRAAVPTPVSGTGDMSREFVLKGEIGYNTQIGGSFLDAGLDLKHDAVNTPRVKARKRNLFTAEPYAQYTINIGRLSLVPGLRFTYSDEWGTYLTPKVSALYKLTPQINIRTSVGRGYRAPDFKELYMEFLNTVGSFSYVVTGNPDLDPEKSLNVSGSMEWNDLKSNARVHVFYNRFDKFIEDAYLRTEGNVDVYTYQNVDNGHTRGFELVSGTQIRSMRVEASYDYLEAIDNTSKLPLLGRSKHSGRIAADYTLPYNIRSSLTFLYTGKAPIHRDTVSQTAYYRSSYTRTDLQMTRPIMRGISVQGGVQNVFNQKPVDWPGIVGRQWFVGGSFRWEKGR